MNIFQAKASTASTTLTDMQSNTTLADACTSITAAKAAQKAAKDCK